MPLVEDSDMNNLMLWGQNEGLQGLWGLCFGHSLQWMRPTLIYSHPNRKTHGSRVRRVCGIRDEPLQVCDKIYVGMSHVYAPYDALCIAHSPPTTFSRISVEYASCFFQISSILYHEPSHLIMLPYGAQCELGSWENEQVGGSILIIHFLLENRICCNNTKALSLGKNSAITIQTIETKWSFRSAITFVLIWSLLCSAGWDCVAALWGHTYSTYRG